jgi:tRNA pseudouridine38-40 synthase
VGFFVMRIKLTVAYDGTEFRGWAHNKGQRTVQSTLKEAVRQVSGDEVEIIGASRTDGGAHARGQVCHFDTKKPIPPHKWVQALNQVLPRDVAVKKSTQVNSDFNARFMAIDRFYRYRILTGLRDPYRERHAHHYGRPLDLEKMQQVAEILRGKHDFLAFTEELESSVTNTVRVLYNFNVRQVRDEVWVDVVGTAFLRGMMRRMSGAILEVGRGHRDVVEVSRLLQPEERLNYQWPQVLPAKGLCLMKIRYGRHPRFHEGMTIQLQSTEDLEH